MRAFLTLLLVFALVCPSLDSAAQSVLRTVQGETTSNVTVLIDQAIVLESLEPFVEVSVAQPEIADVSPLTDRSIYVFGKTRGVTTLTLFGPAGRLIAHLTVRVEPDLAELKERLRTLLPNERVEVRTAGSGLILSGVLSGAAQVDRAMALARAYGGDLVTNMMSVGGSQQVMLRVRIAEMNRSAGKELGISFGARGFTGRTAPTVITGNALSPGDGGRATPSQGATAPGGSGGGLNRNVGAAAAFLGAFGAIFTIADNFILDVQIDALEQKGFARILAEPNLVSLSGSEARFLAGGEVPVPVVDDDGDISISFKPVGVNLNFIPRVLQNDLINLALSAEVSSVDPTLGIVSGGIEITGFNVRRATTTVELRDGQSFAIAGLLQDEFSDTISQVPLLGDLPVLGPLFRSTQFQRGESELVIIITASLVQPVDDGRTLSLPTDRVAIPNEFELFLLGNIEGASPSASVAGQSFDGAFGYVVD